MTVPLKDYCEPCIYWEHDPQSGWNVCRKHGGLTPQKPCDDFEDKYTREREKAEIKSTILFEDSKPKEYKPITEDTILTPLTPEQMSLYYMGYVDGMKWIIKYLQAPEIRRPITDKEWNEFFESISQTNKQDEE